MNLVDDDLFSNGNNNKTNKTSKIIFRIIIGLLVAIVITIIAIVILKNTKTDDETITVTIDGKKQKEVADMIIKTEDDKIYVPIRDISQYLNYKSFNGNYFNKSEETDECYIETNEEVANYAANSNILEKVNKNTEEQTYYTLDEKVEMRDGKLYAISSAIETGFNVYFQINGNEINIYTMDFLVENYKGVAIEEGYKDISDDFDDEKAIFEGLLIVKNKNGKYGVFNADTKQVVLEDKYDKIKYIPTLKDFLVQSNGKVGIITAQGKERISLKYEEIEMISQESNLYLVKNDNKYGVINENEETIIPTNCDSIGIETRNFSKNNLKNKYILFDKLIPVKRNDLWGLYDIEGNLVVKYWYDGFGCTTSRVKNSENLLVIPDYNIIVARKDKDYYLINLNGEQVYDGVKFDSAYMTIDVDEIEYCVTIGEKTYNALDIIKQWTESKSNSEE